MTIQGSSRKQSKQAAVQTPAPDFHPFLQRIESKLDALNAAIKELSKRPAAPQDQLTADEIRKLLLTRDQAINVEVQDVAYRIVEEIENLNLREALETALVESLREIKFDPCKEPWTSLLMPLYDWIEGYDMIPPLPRFSASRTQSRWRQGALQI